MGPRRAGWSRLVFMSMPPRGVATAQPWSFDGGYAHLAQDDNQHWVRRDGAGSINFTVAGTWGFG